MNKLGATAADEAMAIEVLGFLASDPDRLGQFAAMAGIDLADIREAATQPGFLPAVMEFLMQDDAQLIAFAAQSGRRPESVAAAARRLGVDQWERDIP
jgi:hypothetical protein